MSGGFVKEGDQEEVPLVNPRAHLPAGVANYVTPNGMQELKDEQNTLMEERNQLKLKSKEQNRVQINYITAKLQLLEDRIKTAKVVDLEVQPKDKVQFGATVILYKEEDDCNLEYQIVGVDEANVGKNKVSFLSPLAKVLRNKKEGDKIELKTPKGVKNMWIKSIEYR